MGLRKCVLIYSPVSTEMGLGFSPENGSSHSYPQLRGVMYKSQLPLWGGLWGSPRPLLGAQPLTTTTFYLLRSILYALPIMWSLLVRSSTGGSSTGGSLTWGSFTGGSFTEGSSTGGFSCFREAKQEGQQGADQLPNQKGQQGVDQLSKQEVAMARGHGDAHGHGRAGTFGRR